MSIHGTWTRAAPAWNTEAPPRNNGQMDMREPLEEQSDTMHTFSTRTKGALKGRLPDTQELGQTRRERNIQSNSGHSRSKIGRQEKKTTERKEICSGPAQQENHNFSLTKAMGHSTSKPHAGRFTRTSALSYILLHANITLCVSQNSPPTWDVDSCTR
eukprot:1689231-Pleurochrysis_carterae.AAC.1